MEKRILSTIDGSQAVTYTYDKLCRTATRKLDLTTPCLTTYTFLQNSSGGETTFVGSVAEGGTTCNYTYDARGNITSIKEGTEEKLRYTYDSLDQLIRVDDAYEGKTHTYTYDTGGNLTSSADYAYTTGDLGEAESTVTYGYSDTDWKDKLTAYNGQEITYDAIGNPLTYRDGMTFTWQHGRELASYAKNGTTYTYNYDDDGYRVKNRPEPPRPSTTGTAAPYLPRRPEPTAWTSSTTRTNSSWDSRTMVQNTTIPRTSRETSQEF